MYNNERVQLQQVKLFKMLGNLQETKQQEKTEKVAF